MGGKEACPQAATSRSRLEELVVGPFNVRTLAFNGVNSIGRGEVVLKSCQEWECGIANLLKHPEMI